jgi:hypothetical protein
VKKEFSRARSIAPLSRFLRLWIYRISRGKFFSLAGSKSKTKGTERVYRTCEYVGITECRIVIFNWSLCIHNLGRGHPVVFKVH